MQVEIKGKHLRFLDYTIPEFNKLSKLLNWEDKYAKSIGKISLETLLFKDDEGYFTFFGLADLLKGEFREFEVVKDDRKDVYQNLDISHNILDNVTLRDYQHMAVKKAINMKRGIIEIPTAGGKCFAAGTPIMMFDGTTKIVENIIPGDFLMGDDSTSRMVISLARGREEMFKIIPKKGDSYTVNKSHIMSFKVTNKPECRINGQSLKGGELVDISLEDYFSLKKTHKHILKGYRVPVEFPKQSIDVDPYFLGLWLGDSRSDSLPINTPDPEIVDFLEEYAHSLGMNLSKYNDPESKADNYAIIKSHTDRYNELLRKLHKYNLIGDREEGKHPQCHKHVPLCYKANSRDVRLKILAGILDTDGYYHPGNYFDLVLVSKRLFDDVVFIAQTLGFGTTKSIKKVNGDVYYRVHIYGNIDSIPTRVTRKRATRRLQKKNVLMTGVTIESVGEGDYFGFEIEGANKRFLLGDCTVVHNTECALGITRYLMQNNLIKRALIITPSVPIVTQFASRALLRGFKNKEIGLVYGKEKNFNAPVTFAVINTLAQGINKDDDHIINLIQSADLIILDEAHHSKSDSFISVVYLSQAEYLIGMSGTPFKDRANILEDPGDSAIYGLIGKIILKISQKTLVNKGYIADTVIFMKPLPGSFKKYIARFNSIYKREITENKKRNESIVEYCSIFAQNRLKVLVSVNVKTHAQTLMSKLRREHPEISSICVFGGNEALRFSDIGDTESFKYNSDDFARDFENGHYDVIFATQVMDEGVDLPAVGALILGGGGKSLRQLRQRLGRGVRSKKTGKNVVFILDYVDKGHVWMYQQSRKRLSIYLDEVESDVVEVEREFITLIESCYD